jgi:hypothetical protein
LLGHGDLDDLLGRQMGRISALSAAVFVESLGFESLGFAAPHDESTRWAVDDSAAHLGFWVGSILWS